MSDEPSSQEMNQEEILKRAKQFLTLTDIVDNYPAVIERRLTGLIFVLIGGGISLATLVFMLLMSLIEGLGTELIAVVFFVIVSLSVSGIIAFKLVIPLTESYSGIDSTNQETSIRMKGLWLIFALILVISSIYSFGTGQTLIFPIVVQTVLSIGNLMIYYTMKTDPKSMDYSNSHLVLVILVILSIIPIVLFPDIAFLLMVLIDIGGLYCLGIYILITAERILVRSLGRD